MVNFLAIEAFSIVNQPQNSHPQIPNTQNAAFAKGTGTNCC